MTRLGEYRTTKDDDENDSRTTTTRQIDCSSIHEPKQIIFEVDNLPKMVLKFKDIMPCLACESASSDCSLLSSETTIQRDNISRRGSSSNQSNKGEYEEFMSKLKASKLSVNDDERLSLHINEVMKNMAKSVSCISCRTAAERLVKQIMPMSSDAYSLALDPIRLNNAGMISLKPSLLDPDALYILLHIDSNKLEDELNQLVSSKRQVNKRCQLHSTESQKTTRQKWVDEWSELWESIESDEVRKKLLVIDSVELLDALNKYLKRNQFCSDCKLKILIAYKSLTKEAVLEIEKTTYKTEIFSGIECCFNENDPKEPAHLHVRNDKEFIADLIVKAIPEIQGERSERHAKSFEMAQEEVLVCIGLFLYERFFSVYQAMRIQEQAWRILFYTCLTSLVKKLQLEINKKSFDLDQICAELEAIDESRKSQTKQQQQKTANKNKTPKQQKQQQIKQQEVEKPSNNNKESSKHTCYNGDQQAKITTTVTSSTRKTKTKCNKSKKTTPTTTRAISMRDSNACECDDESKFIHHDDDKERNSVERGRCEMSCCFDIIEYWNRLVREDEEEKETARRKVVPRRLKLNYVETTTPTSRNNVDDDEMITEEEKREYFENRARYLALRIERRKQLIEDWKLLSMTNLKLMSINN